MAYKSYISKAIIFNAFKFNLLEWITNWEFESFLLSLETLIYIPIDLNWLGELTTSTIT